jgi:hypothetical protein
MIRLTNDILLFTDLFQDLDQIFLDLDKSEWQFWGRNNNDPNHRIGELNFIKKNSYIFEQINSATRICLDQYMAELNINNDLYYYDEDGIYIRKWDFPMRGMSAHRDYAYDGSGNARPVEYTLCGYLNEDYEGGLIEFPEYGLSLKPPAGSAIVFAAHELHLVTDLIDRHRYMWSSFVYKK